MVVSRQRRPCPGADPAAAQAAAAPLLPWPQGAVGGAADPAQPGGGGRGAAGAPAGGGRLRRPGGEQAAGDGPGLVAETTNRLAGLLVGERGTRTPGAGVPVAWNSVKMSMAVGSSCTTH